MSLDAIAAVLHHSQAVGTDKVVLLGIAWHMGEDPEEGCWPRISTLAKYCNVTERSVMRSLDNLVELGELEVFSKMGSAHRKDKQPNLYYLSLACVNCTGYPSHKTKETWEWD